ncbi:MAG: sugar phosphate nucleotidyltransferase [Thermoplasmatota archaeon]
MKAILLAAGEGSRLRPLTATLPKPMIRVANKPILQYAVEALVANGIRDLVFVVGYHREKVQSFFEDGKRFGCKISYVFQDALLGTAHALAQADFGRGPVIALGGDNVVDAQLLKDLLRTQKEHPDDVALVAKTSDNPSKYGVLATEGDRVLKIVEKPLFSAESEIVNTGVYALPASFEERARNAVKVGTLGITDILSAHIAQRGTVRAARSDGMWMDAVYPWDLLTMNSELLADATAPKVANLARTAEIVSPLRVGAESSIGPQATILPTTCIGDNVAIGPGCVLENCIVMDDVQIGPGAIIKNSIIGEGVRIGARFTALSGPCEARVADGYHALLDFGCVLGPDAAIEGAVTLEPGVLVGAKTKIGTRAVLRRNVDDQTRVV